MAVTSTESGQSLRQLAEARITEDIHASQEQLSPEQIKRELHELRVHQIELLIQQEELLQTQIKLEDSRSSYFDLYEYAPVGYLSLDDQGLILRANLTAVNLLGVKRIHLVKRPISNFIFREDQDIFYLNKKHVLENNDFNDWEMRLTNSDGHPVWMHIHATRENSNGLFLTFSNITERKHAESALRVSEERYKNIVESQTEFVVRYLPGGILTYVNGALARLTGTEPETLLGKSFYPLLHENDQEEIARTTESITPESSTKGSECRIILPDNSFRWTRWTQKGIFDEHGALIEYQSVGKDITDQKLAEFRLQESEQKYRLIFECAGDSISIMDLHGKLLAVNPQACKMLDYTYDEAICLSADKIDARPEEMAANITTLMETGYYLGETEFIRKDGSTLPISVSARLISWEGQPAILSVCRDITDRKQMELSLRASQEVFSLFMKYSPIYTFIKQVEEGQSRVIQVSDNYIELVGKTSAELLGCTMYDMFPADLARKITEDDIAIMKNGTILQVDEEFNGRSFTTIKCPILTDNKLGLLVGFTIDITDRKKAEQDLLEMERQMLHVQKLESLGVMAGGIAHDFNNLLQTILGNIELATHTVGSDSKSQKYISYAMKAAIRASHLTNLMLTYAGKGFVAKRNLNLNDVIKEYIELMKTAVTTSVEIMLSLAAELPDISANESQIQQIIMNLITNGSESIEMLHGCVNISTGVMNCDKKYLDATLLHENVVPGMFAYLDVTDNGCGMSKDTLGRLIDPFFTTKFTGRGLGMSVVVGILKSHGGTLLVDSEPGKGTRIRVLLPASETYTPEMGIVPLVSTDDKHIAQGKSFSGVVLVVDDEKQVLKTCAKMVELAGFKVMTARDGLDAIAKFREYQDEIELVLMDLTMPNMDGLTAMSEIHEIRPDMKVILASGFNQEELSKRITDKPPSGFIRKPYSMSVLKAELQRVIVTELHP